MKRKWFSLSPLLLFLVLYLATSLIAGDFYKVPISVAFLVSAVYAIAISPGSLADRIETFSKGAGSTQMMLMLWISDMIISLRWLMTLRLREVTALILSSPRT